MKRWLGYILFGMCAVVVFLYVLFPAKSVKAYIAHQINQIDPQLELTAGDPFLRLPPGIKLRDASITFNKAPLIRLESLSFFPRIRTLLASEQAFGYLGRAYQGETSGELFLAKEGTWRINGSGEGFQTELMPIAALIPQGTLSGSVAGQFDFSANQGTINLTLDEGALTLAEPLLEIESINFTQLTLDAIVDGNQMQVKEVQMTGPEINGNLTGKVTFKRPLNDSILNISGMIKPHPLFLADLRKKLPPGILSDQIAQKGITFNINGTVREPQLSF